MQPTPPCPAPTGWWQMWASVLLLHWQLWLGMYSVLFCFSSFLFSLFCWPLRFQNSPQTCLCKGFLLCGNFSSFTTSSPGWVSIPNSFVIICVFYILSYLLSKRMGCLSGCLGALHQHSEVVLWKLISIQMIFWWICRGESGLHVLFLCHLGTTSFRSQSLLLDLCSTIFLPKPLSSLCNFNIYT